MTVLTYCITYKEESEYEKNKYNKDSLKEQREISHEEISINKKCTD